MLVLGLLACLLFGFALVSRRLEGTPVTAAMVFVAAGPASTRARCAGTRFRDGCC